MADVPPQSASVDEALARLRSSDPDVQRAAALELGALGDPRALKPLVEAFHTESWLVRGACVRAILAIGGSEALNEFSQALHEGDARVRNAAVEIFRGMGRTVVEPLIGLLKDSDPNVVRYAIELLGEIGDPIAAAPILKAVQAGSDENVRYQGLLSIGKLGALEGVPALRKALSDSLWVQTAALEAIGMLGAEELEPDLLDLVTKAEIWALPTVLDALGKVGTRRSLMPLYQFIVSDEELSQLALRAFANVALKPGVEIDLGQSDQEAVMRVARGALDSTESDLRVAAIDTLGRFGDASAVDKLIPLLNSRETSGALEALEEEEPAAVAQALIAVGKAAEAPLLEAFTKLDLTAQILAIEVLGKVGGEQAGKLLVQLLDHEDVEINRAAADALGNIGDAQFADALIFQFQHPSASVRSAAHRALARLSVEVVFEKVLPLFEDPIPEVRAMAAATLGELKDHRAVEPLKHLLVDPDNQVKQAAVFALAALEERKVGSLPLLLLGSDNAVLRRSAAQVLGQLRDRRAVEPLIYLLQDRDLWVRFQAARALAEIGDERAAPAIAKCLQDEVGLVRVAAAEALGELWKEKAASSLDALLGDPEVDVRRTVVQLLVALRGKGAAPALARALQDDSWKVRLAALHLAEKVPTDEVLAQVRNCTRDEHVLVRQNAGEVLEHVERAVGIGG